MRSLSSSKRIWRRFMCLLSPPEQPRRQDTRNAGQIGNNAYVAPGRAEHRGHAVLTSVAKLEHEPAARMQHARGVGDQPFVDFKARRSGEQSDFELIIAHSALQTPAIARRNVCRLRA